MVERLKAAIEKARADRAGGPGAAPAGSANRGADGDADGGADGIDAAWRALDELALDARTLRRERIVTRDKENPAHIAFDALRTKLVRALGDNRWTRVVVTSPTQSCGKTMVAANLAFSLARQPETRCMLLDLDLRAPELGQRLGQHERHAIEPWLVGEVPPGAHLRRVGANLALGLNSRAVRNSAELIQGRRLGATLGALDELYRPDVVLFDTPPMLAGDDVLALLPHVDGVLLVAGGGRTTASEVEECERLMAEHTNFLGVVLNKAEDRGMPAYYPYEDA